MQNQLFLEMAMVESILSILPEGYVIVGDPVPLPQHWTVLESCSHDFDPNLIWSYIQKLMDATNKQFNICVFCKDR